MLDWRGVVGTSVANGGLAVLLAGFTVPFGATCADCGGGWWLQDPDIPRTFDLPPHVSVLPLPAAVQPVVAPHTPYRIDFSGRCPGQLPVDRLPAIDSSRPRPLPAVTACIRVDADGHVDRVRPFGQSAAGATAALQRLTFVPAMRGGVTVASWVEVRADR